VIEETRLKVIKASSPCPGRYVLYWMQSSQRTAWNHALAYAIEQANGVDLPVLVFFGLTARYPEANLRHYAFVLDGLRETAQDLAERGIRLVVRKCHPPDGALALAREGALVMVDRGYLRHQRSWRRELGRQAACPVIQVEADAVVPVQTAYPKAAWNAAVLRRRLTPLLPRFLRPLEEQTPRRPSLSLDLPGLDLSNVQAILKDLAVDRSVPPVDLPAGTQAARERPQRFIEGNLDRYPDERNDPGKQATSGLSPYLHFGQVSTRRGHRTPSRDQGMSPLWKPGEG
jgi:deoxyribodipyrimidine photo-lyase